MNMAKTSSYAPGDTIKGWTLVELKEDGANVFLRRWLIQCACGYQAFKWEEDLRVSRLRTCISCGVRKSQVKKEPAP